MADTTTTKITDLYNTEHVLIYPKTVVGAIEGLDDKIASTISASISDLNTSIANTISTKLAGVVTSASLANTLSNYVTTSALNTALNNKLNTADFSTEWNNNWSIVSPYYVSTSALTANYYTKNEVDAKIPTSSGSTISGITQEELNTALSEYTKTESLSTWLSEPAHQYIKNTDLSTALGNYVMTTSLNTALENYLTSSAIDEAYVSKTALTSSTGYLSSYVTNTELTDDYYNRTQTENIVTTLTNSLSTEITELQDYSHINQSIILSLSTEGNDATGSTTLPFRSITKAAEYAKTQKYSGVTFQFITAGTYDIECNLLSNADYVFNNINNSNIVNVNFVNNTSTIVSISNSTLSFSNVVIQYNGANYNPSGTVYGIEFYNSYLYLNTGVTFYPSLAIYGGALKIAGDCAVGAISAHEANVALTGALRFCRYNTSLYYALNFENCQATLTSSSLTKFDSIDDYLGGLRLVNSTVCTTSAVLNNLTNLSSSNSLEKSGTNLVITSNQTL